MSERNRLAARNYEDLLQVCRWLNIVESPLTSTFFKCAILVFDGLLPEPHNTNILKLIFTCAHWHGLAKLCMHTNEMLDLLDSETVRIGAALRTFTNKMCPAFETRELKSEIDAQNRRRKKASGNFASKDSQTLAKRKTFNNRTIKCHFLGDHSKSIRRFGTTDSYSTEPVRSSGISHSSPLTAVFRASSNIERLNLAFPERVTKTSCPS